MKLFVVALFLALTASTSAGIYKIIEKSKDRVINDYNDEALLLATVNEINKDSQRLVTNGYNASASASIIRNEILEESDDRMSNSYKADALPLNGVYEFRDESDYDNESGYNNDVINKENEHRITNPYKVQVSALNGFNETYKESEGRITNGYNAYPGQFPHQVSIYISKYQKSTFCGGSLIGSQWVLTAAHCTYGAQSVTVYLGSNQLYQGTRRTAAKNNIIIHQYYNPNTFKNDISLIKIPAVSLNNPYIQPIKLPAISNYYSSYVGQSVLVAGWGQTYRANYLQWSRFQVVDNNVCANTFGSYFTSTNICIPTPGGVSPCFGDSGGAMMLENSKVQIGVFSFLGNSCQSGNPTAFTRVTSYLDWIKYYTGIYYT